MIDKIAELIDSDRHKFVLIEGQGGTGKSFMTSKAIAESTINPESVLLSAPSHTAKDNLFVNVKDHTGISYDACTVTSLLGKIPYIDYNRRKNVFARTKKEAGEVLGMYRLLIVDEVFMITLSDIIALMQTVEEYPSLTVIFLGDRKQLLPVEGKSPAEFFDNSDHIHKIELTKVYRQSGDLLKACDIIRNGVSGTASLSRIRRKLKSLDDVQVVDIDTYDDGEMSVAEVAEDLFPKKNFSIISYTNHKVIQNNVHLDGNNGFFRKGQEIITYNNCYEVVGDENIPLLEFWGEWRETGRVIPAAKNSERLTVAKASEPQSAIINSQHFSDMIKFRDLKFDYQYLIVRNSVGATFTIIALNYALNNELKQFCQDCINFLSTNLKEGIIRRKSEDYKYYDKLNKKMLSFVANGVRPTKSITCHKSQGQTIENVIVDMTRLPTSNLNNYLYTAASRASKSLTLIGH